MAGQRIKGQEVEVLLVSNGAPQTNITTIQSFEVTLDNEIISEGYLGETTERKDAIFKGVSGKMELHFSDQAILKLYKEIVDKARRRTPGVKINIKATLNFPGGQRPRVLITDAEFGPMPIGFGSRKDYGKAALDFASGDLQFLF